MKNNCVGCADCCKTQICPLGKYVHGENTVAPCPSLRYRKKRYWCHLVEIGVPVDKQIEIEKDKVFGIKSIEHVKNTLEIGSGCPQPDNHQRKIQIFNLNVVHAASRIELGIRNSMITEEEYNDQFQEDRDIIVQKYEEFKQNGKEFQDAIKLARLEFIENVLSEFIHEVTNGDLRNQNPRENIPEEEGKRETENYKVEN